MNQSVVIIGAGPVGLWLAIQLSQRYHVQVLEKRESYARSQTLRINKKRVSQQPCARLNALLDRLLPGSKVTVPILTLKAALKTEALLCGVELTYVEVRNVLKDVIDRHGDALVIGCDGAHSLVRQQLFHNELSLDERLQRAVIVKYNTPNIHTRSLHRICELYPTLKLMQAAGVDHVSPHRSCTDKRTVRLDLLISEPVYELVKDATSSRPYGPERFSTLPAELREAITVWINARQLLLDDRMEPSSLTVEALPLDAKGSKKVGLMCGDQAVFLAGDAATSLPLYRGLNHGLRCANMLSALLCSPRLQLPAVVAKYNTFVRRSAWYELMDVRRLKLAARLSLRWLGLAALLPCQASCWTIDEQEQLRSTPLNLGLDQQPEQLDESDSTSAVAVTHPQNSSVLSRFRAAMIELVVLRGRPSSVPADG